MKHYRKAAYAAVVGLLAVFVSACGSSSSSSSAASSSSSSSSSNGGLALKPGESGLGQNLYNGKPGGTLTVYSQEDFEHFDPGEAYFVLDYSEVYVTQRPLFIYPPNSTTTLAPDLATAVPTLANGGITDGGKTVTVHIEPNVKYAPPVNRAVTSQDVAYAIERGANPNVGNAYFVPYFGDIVGASSAKGGPISGHPDAELDDDRLPSDEADRRTADRGAQPAAVIARCRRRSPARLTSTPRRSTAQQRSPRRVRT